MKTASMAVIAMLAAPLQLASAQSSQWRTVTIPQTGTSVDLPSSIFSEGAGAPEQAYGERFQTADHRANLTVQATANDARLSAMVTVAMMIMSPILAQTGLMMRLLSSEWSREIWRTLYYSLPKVYDLGTMTQWWPGLIRLRSRSRPAANNSHD